MDTVDETLVCAFVLDRDGKGHAIEWDGITGWRPEDGLLWVHLEIAGPRTEHWLREESGLDPVVCDALMSGDVRPRAEPTGDDAMLVNLRGVNLNPGADPDDMVAIRLWISAERIVSVRRRKLLTIRDLRERIMAGRGPTHAGEFLTEIAGGLMERMGGVITDLDDRVDELEDQVLTVTSNVLRPQLSDIRKSAIALRRYLAPQREALARIQTAQPSWMEERDRARLRETLDTLVRYIEDLDSARERAAVTQEELNSMLADRMNRTMYVLTIVAALLLPPSLIVGLFGINVGGMPGVEHEWAFYEVIGLMIVFGIAQFFILRKLKWI